MKAPSLFVHRALPVIVFAVILTGWSDPERPATAPPATTPTQPSTPSPTPSQTPSATPAVDPDCVAGPGRTVQKVAAIQVPAVVVPPVTYTDKSGQQQTAVEGFTIPAQSIDAGCVVRYDAPGGCLGAIKISAAVVPPVTIPESTVTGSGKSFAAVTVPGVTAPAVSSPLVCQVENAGVLPTVTRRGVVRRGVARNGTARPGGRVKADGDRPEFRVESVKLPAVRLPDVDVDPVRLESRKLPGEDVDVFTGDDKVSYVAPGDVLFDTDQATIRPDAAKALHAIAVKIKAAHPNARLRVEGHTDDRGDAAYGMRLSERRAAAVAAWLIRTEHFSKALITTKGFGETAPAVPNTSDANRQKNRRVVITVSTR
jgi:outer membrane protein OmpA-like peptidoglycan-associated protein